MASIMDGSDGEGDDRGRRGLRGAARGLDRDRDAIGGIASVTVLGLTAKDRTDATAAGLELGPVSLQQLVIHRTNTSEKEFEVSA